MGMMINEHSQKIGDNDFVHPYSICSPFLAITKKWLNSKIRAFTLNQ